MKKYLLPGWLVALLALCLLVTMVSLFVIRVNDLHKLTDQNAEKDRQTFCQYFRAIASQPGTPGMTPEAHARADAIAAKAQELLTRLGCAP